MVIKSLKNYYDIVIIGGGFFGLYLGYYLQTFFKNILILEKEGDFMQRASYSNQARVHNGYHYPRSILTAFRSRVNFPIFIREFPESIVTSFTKLYAISKYFSKVTSNQYMLFMKRIGAPIREAPKQYRHLFNENLIEQIFLAEEYGFDPVILKESMIRKIERTDITTALKTNAVSINSNSSNLLNVILQTSQDTFAVDAKYVFNCTYSNINYVRKNSHLLIIPLKHEITEMPLLDMPEDLQHLGITVMCGPFFSTMPFPPKNLHSLSHVRYTPRYCWYDNDNQYFDGHEYFKRIKKISNFNFMIKDAQRYLPIIKESVYKDSLWEIKTTLPISKSDDGRPILFCKNAGLKNFHTIMGGKIDNIYDIIQEIKDMYKKGEIS